MPRLVRPDARYAASYADALDEGLGLYPPAVGESDLARRHFDRWLAAETDMRRRILLADGSETPRVPFSLFWLVDDARFIARVNIRHYLTPALLVEGGHIGYAVRAAARRQGHGHALLRLALPEAVKLGLSRVLLTCDDDNAASIRIIEKAGGTLQDTVTPAGASRPVRRYWLTPSRKDHAT